MTGNEMPSATGVRITGDEYQWLYVWRACMEALHHDLTKNTNNPTIAIGAEEPGVGKWRRRRSIPPAHPARVYRLNTLSTTAFRSAAPTWTKGYFQKFATTRHLYRQRRSCRNAVRHKPPSRSHRRPAERSRWSRRDWSPRRPRWTDDEREQHGQRPQAPTNSLMALFDDLHFDLAYEYERLRDEVALLMTANGLRSDDKCSRSRYEVGLPGYRRAPPTDLADINKAITTLALQVGSTMDHSVDRDHQHDDPPIKLPSASTG